MNGFSPAVADHGAAQAGQSMLDPNVQASVIASSHDRCARLGLGGTEAPDFGRPAPGRWREVLEHNQMLRRHAAPVMATLREQIVRTHSMVVLTDSAGLILHTLGDDDFLARAQKVALAPGVCWSEREKGTNAIGTALFESRPTVVHADQHYLRINHFLTCSAAPIFDPLGQVAGVLDVTGDHRSHHLHTMALVRMSASMIENRLVQDSAGTGFRLRLHRRPEFIGTLAEAIATFDGDGRLVGANQVAREHYALRPNGELPADFDAVFGLPAGAALDRQQRDANATLTLYLGGRIPVFAKIERLGATRTWIAPAPREASSRPVAPAAAAKPARPALALQALDTGDAAMAAAIAKARRIIGRDIPLLILGETGTGKELLAKAMHADSARAGQPFVAVNCASLPETLIESELFGYEEGAFTGARRRGYSGRFQQANGGTLFLDEIGDMPLALQARLLRVLQERQVVPLGGQLPVPVDVTVICATHRNLRDRIAAGTFREDLYYRLNGLSVRLPPLRLRTDLDALVAAILGQFSLPGPRPSLSAEVDALLRRCRWPGNIRQLSNLLRTACAMAGDAAEIRPEHLPDDFYEELAESQADATDTRADGPVGSSPLQDVERNLIERTLAANGGNVSSTARQLGISRNTVYRKARRPATPRS